MKYQLTLFLLALGILSNAQVIQTLELSKEKCWVLNSNLNLPATKFHFVNNSMSLEEPDKEVKGYLELFTSFGIGLSLNYGNAIFKKNVNSEDSENIQTDFSNLIGIQVGVLYSSKSTDDQENGSVNEFSIYGGINILDIQLGVGYEYGARRSDASRWFVSVSYGIPIYKLTGRGSHVLRKRNR